MKNFLVRIASERNEEICNKITKIFSDNFLEPNDNLDNKKDKYILTDNYVERYIIPYLYKQNSHNNLYSVNCELDIPTESLSPNKINIHLYGCQIYFENIENTSYNQIKNEDNIFPIKTYKIKNKNVLLIHGFFNYRDNVQNGKCETNKNKNNCVKDLYNYIKNSGNIKTNLKDCLKNIEGNFVIIYIEYEKDKQINIYFFNDQFGMKSFIYFYEQNSIILTNMYNPFIHYKFNYINVKKNEYIFNDESINKYENLFESSNNLIYDKDKYINSDHINYKNNISINNKIGINIPPYNIYKIIFNKNCEILFEKIKKDNCIYTEDYQWENKEISLKDSFEIIINFLKKNIFLFSDINYELDIDQLNIIIKTLCNQIKDNPKDKENFQNILSEIKLNNIFINLYLKLLNYVIKKKIQNFFNSNNSQKRQNEINFCTYQNNTQSSFTTKSITILFSGSVDSMLLSIITIHNFFSIYENGYIELINVCFDENAIDRYTCLVSYEQINKMFPKYDIRLLLIDVKPQDLIKYEKIIYFVMSPNSSIMDYNISSALFFANFKKGYILSPTFFSTPDWKCIKKKVLPFININMQKNELPKLKTQKENQSKNKCSVCEFKMNPNCVHKACSLCCRKLRYIYYNRFFLKKNKNDEEITKTEIAQSACPSTTVKKEGKEEGKEEEKAEEKAEEKGKGEEKHSGLYQVHVDSETGKDVIYLFVKKKKVLINFDIYYNCIAHKERLYNYQEIDNLFTNFNKELSKFNRSKENCENGQNGQENRSHNNFVDNFVNNFIQIEKANLNSNGTNSEEQIRNLLCKKKKTEKKKTEKKNKNFFLNSDIKEEEESLNHLSKELYRRCNGLALSKSEEEKERRCYCKDRMIIIGSGADELYGGYYRQNNKIQENGNLKKNNYKLKEMIKDIKRLWIRNLYRDDRIITYANKCEQYVFYPYLDINLINFLFSIPFQIVEKPINIINLYENEDENNNLICSQINEHIINSDKNNVEIKFNYLINNLDEHYKLYTSINDYKICKWILRMSLYFLKLKNVMFFKKKAIQFGSKAKHISKYMEDFISSCTYENKEGKKEGKKEEAKKEEAKEEKKKEKKKGDDQYTLSCIQNVSVQS
ncbi:hypothetical protein YYC_00543 [Plasmodium yoelii 17X]|uniref:Glutamine amidotransferase type-2 domain-containing protein n=1 Tax=Plasmodium yoelii 17X TaxID=1323249 RepID=V7PXN6_PLAYE|nr:hypothetical protein YYC_00543 [Plasmodium yoelii 17X]